MNDTDEQSDSLIPKANGPIDEDGNPIEDLPGKRGVNAFQLTMMIYFFTCGGPFGIEASVGAAGPFLTLIAFAVIPLLWSLPQALLAAELALLIPENGGNVVWVQVAFGNFIGFINAYNNLASSFAGNALLVVLFVDYIPIELTPLQDWLVRIGFIVLSTILNIVGIKWMSRISLFLLLFVLSPFFAEIFWVIYTGRLDVRALREIPPSQDIQWGLFLSTVIWCYGGFDQMGAFAGEVKGGRSTFIAGILGSFPLIFLNYFFPIFVGYSLDTHWRHWVSGYFGPLAYKIGTWMGVWVIAASAVSNFGQFNANFAPQARVVWAMAQGEGLSRKMPGFLGWSWRSKSGTLTPVAAILFVGVICVLVTAIPFNVLVEMFLMIRIVNLIAEYGSLIMLRYTMKDKPRPFTVPGGMVGAWLLGVPTFALAGFALSQADYIVWSSGAVVNGGAILGYGGLYLYNKYFGDKGLHTPRASVVGIN